MPPKGVSATGRHFRLNEDRFTLWTPNTLLFCREVGIIKDVNRITGVIVDTAYRLHSRVGPGLMETFYKSVMAHSLEKQGLQVEKQKRIPFEWEQVRIEEACRLDLLVEGCVIVELKSVERLHPVHQKQVLTDLRLLDLPVALLINFGEMSLKNGIHRILNNRATTAAMVAA